MGKFFLALLLLGLTFLSEAAPSPLAESDSPATLRRRSRIADRDTPSYDFNNAEDDCCFGYQQFGHAPHDFAS
jgi:hypothetical protein